MLDLCIFLSWFRHKAEAWFELQNVLMMGLFHTNTQLFTSQDGNWWTVVMWSTCDIFYQLFGYSDGTHSLLRIQWGTSDVMLHLFKSDEEINSSASWMTIFWWTTSKIQYKMLIDSHVLSVFKSNSVEMDWVLKHTGPNCPDTGGTAWLGFAVCLLDAAKRKLSSFLEVRPIGISVCPFYKKWYNMPPFILGLF